MAIIMNVAILGCGVIGQKRALAISKLNNIKLKLVYDQIVDRMESLIKGMPYFVEKGDSWQDVLKDNNIDAVIVSTTNNYLGKISLDAVKHGKHVLVEKPAACNVGELILIREEIEKIKKQNIVAKVGYNIRYHVALQQAKKIVEQGDLGELMFIRARYGHGGRVGYDKEWRADKTKAGGGELIDQGVHLIDLSRWFLGDFVSNFGDVQTYFWDMKVEDNAFISLKTQTGKIAWLQASCTEWKNTFSFEIYGEKGKLQVDGLGGSYGIERLSWYKMSEKMGPPETLIWEYPGEDNSWFLETKDFFSAIEGKITSASDIIDACAVLDIVDAIYKKKD